mgnify:FL=1|tara:strand:- start:1092 stop:1274 length:183 start_codon:yes stop_codon:yes gene_type:complete
MKEHYEFYINNTLFDKKIKRMEHITEKIIYVYCDNWVYIFNFAGSKIDYIKTLRKDKIKN